jgi:midasin
LQKAPAQLSTNATLYLYPDVQEYIGGYSSDVNGSLSFQDGILVRALRRGHWVILDELNLAPSEVLEALNRLLDDNRELYLPDIDETVKPHPNFRLFATQNPSGAYGGRKPLSRAFRNRFVEIHMGDIPSDEMKTILEKRCSCPPSHAKALVKIMIALRQRRNAHGVFLGKDGLITPRDLLRWAERGGSSKLALAQEGYMLLAERLRNDAEKAIVKEEIESHLKVTIDCDDMYYGKDAEARAMLTKAAVKQKNLGLLLSSVAPTKSLLRLLTLVSRCVQQKEPVLLVGGKSML